MCRDPMFSRDMAKVFSISLEQSSPLELAFGVDLVRYFVYHSILPV